MSKSVHPWHSCQMPRMLRMPGKDVLPPGPKRDLVTELFVHYREAARPSLPQIATLTKTMPNPHPVSRETIRRLLAGTTTSQWPAIDALLRALCHLQDRDPDGRRWAEPKEGHWGEDNSATCREYLRQLWNNDIDGLETDDASSGLFAASAPPAGRGVQSRTVPAARQPSDDWRSSQAGPATEGAPWATTEDPKIFFPSNYGGEPAF